MGHATLRAFVAARRTKLLSVALPIITDRLRLELPTRRRESEYPPLIGDRTVSRWLLRVPYPYRSSDAREYIARGPGKRRSGTALGLAIIDASSDRLVGGVGLGPISWEHKHAEIGYWLGRPYWGLGYASEAVQAVVATCFRDLKFHRVEAGVFRGNEGSENVLRKAGFALEGVRREAFLKDGEWLDDLLFGLTESDWRRWLARRKRS